jgi:hypothetical protein
MSVSRVSHTLVYKLYVRIREDGFWGLERDSSDEVVMVIAVERRLTELNINRRWHIRGDLD